MLDSNTSFREAKVKIKINIAIASYSILYKTIPMQLNPSLINEIDNNNESEKKVFFFISSRSQDSLL